MPKQKKRRNGARAGNHHMSRATRAGRVRVNAWVKRPTLADVPRALKIIQDFNFHIASMDWARKDAARDPEKVDDTPDKWISPEDLMSICYSRAAAPDEILMQKEEELDADHTWDRLAAQFFAWRRRVLSEPVSLGGEGGVFEEVSA